MEFREYPKALYLHPKDDQEQKTKVVENPNEEELALAQGWKREPYIPGVEVVSAPEPVAEPVAKPQPDPQPEPSEPAPDQQ